MSEDNKTTKNDSPGIASVPPVKAGPLAPTPTADKPKGTEARVWGKDSKTGERREMTVKK